MAYAIVDRKGLPTAYGYYNMYRYEPSILPGWDLTLDTVEGINNITLHDVVKGVIKAAQGDRYKQCPEILLVCHGRSDELIMPIAAGSAKHATRNALEMLASAVSLVEALPGDRSQWSEPQWITFIHDVQLASLNLDRAQPTSIAQATSAMDRIAREETGLTTQGFFELMADLRKARKASPPKLEVRACNFGKSDSLAVLEWLGILFNTPMVIAPSQKTMYAHMMPGRARARSQAELENKMKAMGGKYKMENGFAIKVQKVDPDPIKFTGGAQAVTDEAIVAFIHQHVRRTPRSVPNFAVEDFYVSGLYREEDWSKAWPYTMPAEFEYRSLFVQKTIPIGKLTNLAPGKVDFSRATRRPATSK
jgi:hypothetical protein